MTGLLVSVRDAAEAKIARAGGADIIDVKEPRRGALGPADTEIWSEIQAASGGRAVTSVALGELLHDPVEALATRAVGFRFAKIGLAGCHQTCDWVARWTRAIRQLPPGTHAVPVAYADWPRAIAPSPSVALWLAERSLAKLLLIDTWDKSGGTLLDLLSWQTLREVSRHARQAGVRLVLAGSLHCAAITKVQKLAPAYIGVRGAACSGGRDGTIDLARVKSLVRLVHAVRLNAAS